MTAFTISRVAALCNDFSKLNMCRSDVADGAIWLRGLGVDVRALDYRSTASANTSERAPMTMTRVD
jgi:hypothetical protein